MVKIGGKEDSSGGASASAVPAADAASKSKEADAGASKKKAPAKPRKRKTSDAGIASKASAAQTKKAAVDDLKGDKYADKAGGSGGQSSDTHLVAAAAIKPFVKGELLDSIKHMMFGFGDGVESMNETAELMEDLVVEYVGNMTKKAMEIAQIKGKLDPECFTFLLSKDPEQYERINELLRANDEFRAVLNSGFDPSDEKMY